MCFCHSIYKKLKIEFQIDIFGWKWQTLNKLLSRFYAKILIITYHVNHYHLLYKRIQNKIF